MIKAKLSDFYEVPGFMQGLLIPVVIFIVLLIIFFVVFCLDKEQQDNCSSDSPTEEKVIKLIQIYLVIPLALLTVFNKVNGMHAMFVRAKYGPAITEGIIIGTLLMMLLLVIIFKIVNKEPKIIKLPRTYSILSYEGNLFIALTIFVIFINTAVYIK